MLTTRLNPYMPASIVNSVRRDFDELFNQALGNRAAQAEQSSSYLPLSIWGDDEHFYVHADVPGFDRDTLDVIFKDGQLWIRGERKVTREDGRFWHNERVFGQFERAIAIPDTIDAGSIEAQLADGVLAVRLTKKPEAQPTKVSIKSPSNGNQKRLSDPSK